MLNKEIFSQRLKELRNEKSLSMQSLAQILGLKNKGSIGQFETRINAPSADIFVAIAEYFNVSLDYLAGRTDNREMKK